MSKFLINFIKYSNMFKAKEAVTNIDDSKKSTKS